MKRRSDAIVLSPCNTPGARTAVGRLAAKGRVLVGWGAGDLFDLAEPVSPRKLFLVATREADGSPVGYVAFAVRPTRIPSLAIESLVAHNRLKPAAAAAVGVAVLGDVASRLARDVGRGYLVADVALPAGRRLFEAAGWQELQAAPGAPRRYVTFVARK